MKKSYLPSRVLYSFILGFLLSISWLAYLQAKAIEGVVNINTASVSELTMLPGIGKAKAEQIIQMRQGKPYGSIEDLKSIKGLGAKRLEAMRPHVVTSGPTTAKKLSSPKATVAPVSTPAAPVIKL